MILLRGIIPRSSLLSLPPRARTRQRCRLRTTKSWLLRRGPTNHARQPTIRTIHPRHTIPLLLSHPCQVCKTRLPCSHGTTLPAHISHHPLLFRTFMRRLHLLVWVYPPTIAAIRPFMVRRGDHLPPHRPRKHGPRNIRPRQPTIRSNSHSQAVRRDGARPWDTVPPLLLRRGQCRWPLLG